MPRGAPDYQILNTQTVRTENTTINGNVFEVGFSRLDGGGRVVYFDDFRNGINKYTRSFVASGTVPSISTTGLVGVGFGYPVKFDAVAVNSKSYMRRYFDLSLSGKIGVEVGLMYFGQAAEFMMDFANYINQGSAKSARVIFRASDKKVYVVNAGGETSIKSYVLPSYMSGRNLSFKIVYDPFLEIYTGAYLGGDYLPLNIALNDLSYPLDKGGMYVSFMCQSLVTNYNLPIYLNYVAITADEP